MDMNYEDVFLRDVTLGVLNLFKDKINWYNNFDNNTKLINVPFTYNLYGSERFLFDSLIDDVPGDRVELNIDKIPRCIIAIDNINMQLDRLNNINNSKSRVIEILDNDKVSIKKLLVETKLVPIEITYTLKGIFKTEIDIFKFWEKIYSFMIPYKHFSFEYSRDKVQASIRMTDTMTNTIPREGDFKTTTVAEIETNLIVNTIYPIFDMDNAIPYNKRVNFVSEVKYSNELPKQ